MQQVGPVHAAPPHWPNSALQLEEDTTARCGATVPLVCLRVIALSFLCAVLVLAAVPCSAAVRRLLAVWPAVLACLEEARSVVYCLVACA